jgi:hypothetical protein
MMHGKAYLRRNAESHWTHAFFVSARADFAYGVFEKRMISIKLSIKHQNNFKKLKLKILK